MIRKEIAEATQGDTETRGIRQSDAMFYNSGNTLLENRMIELENMIWKIEATIFSFERFNTSFLSPIKTMDYLRSTNGIWWDAILDFCKRLDRIDSVTERLIETLARKDQNKLNDSFNNETNSPVSKHEQDNEEWIERRAENLLSIADQKYRKYFESWGVDEQLQKDCAFKDLFNLNHQLIKLLQSSENKANSETLKAQRSKRIIQEIDTIFREEGKRNMNTEFKILNEQLINENDDLIQECVSLKNEIERFQNSRLTSPDQSFYKEQIDILEKKNEVLLQKIKNLEQEHNQKSQQNHKVKEGGKVLFARFEETNAALERAFERISVLEAENNSLIGSVSNEKAEREKLSIEFDKLSSEYKKINDDHEKFELERTHAKEHLRVNNEHVDRIKNEK